MNKATETTENKKVYQFPVNKETYDAYVEDKKSDDDISNEDVSDENITFETDNEMESFKELFNFDLEDLDDLDDESYEILDDELYEDLDEESFENINKAILEQIDNYKDSEESKSTGTNETSLVPVTSNKNNTSDKSKSSGNTSNNNNSTKSGSTTKTYNYYGKTSYDKKGRKNITDFKGFVQLCLPTQEELKVLLVKELIAAGYTDVISADGYIYAKGNIPVLLTAHMDTVHRKRVEDFYEYYDENKKQHIISSPQGIGGDDRCGIYMILQIIKTHKCSVLFCEDEECGGIGSKKFVKTALIKEIENMKYMIELDRMNGKDAVFYSCDNADFTKFIESNTGYKKTWGSFSDISTLMPAAGVAGVNFSCGYYNAHQTSEYVIVEEMLNTINVVKKLLDVKCDKFKYVARSYGNYGGGYYGGYYGRSWNGWDEDDWDDYYMEKYGYGNGFNSRKKKEEKTKFVTLFIYLNEAAKTEENCFKTYVVSGTSIEEAFGKFFMEEMDYCFVDVYDYEVYDDDYGMEGWLYE